MQDSASVKNWAEINRNGFSESLDYFARDLKRDHCVRSEIHES
jgi:hypothetical protein